MIWALAQRQKRGEQPDAERPALEGKARGDDRDRFLCAACGVVHYQNPRVVVGCIPERGERVLLCRRAIDPCCGKWTLPAGYLENGETVAAGAERETCEEAGARIQTLVPYRMFNICHINQIYFMFVFNPV